MLIHLLCHWKLDNSLSVILSIFPSTLLKVAITNKEFSHSSTALLKDSKCQQLIIRVFLSVCWALYSNTVPFSLCRTKS